MFNNIFNTAKAHIKGGKKYPKINVINIENSRNFEEVKKQLLDIFDN